MTGQSGKPQPVWRRRWTGLTIFSAIGVIIVGSALFWTYSSNLRRYPPDVADRDSLALPLPDSPSVVVMPFAAVSGGPRDALMARRLETDIRNVLARVPDLFVIASETAIRYRGARFQLKRPAEALGVRYVVTGTLTASNGSIRMFYRLVDAFTGEVEWHGDYQKTLHDLPATRDLALAGILDELDRLPGKAGLAALTGPLPRDPATWLAVAEVVNWRVPEDRDSMRASLDRLRAAAVAEPGWATVEAEIAWTCLNAESRAWPDADRCGHGPDSGLAAAERVMALDPADPRGPARKADLLAVAGISDGVLDLRQRAARLGPNDFNAQWDLATALAAAGRPADALPAMRRALRLHPLHPVNLTRVLAETEIAAGAHEAALRSLDAVIERRPASPVPRVMQIYVLVQQRQLARAQQEAERLLALHPGYRLADWRRPDNPVRANRAWLAALRQAGIPD